MAMFAKSIVTRWCSLVARECHPLFTAVFRSDRVLRTVLLFLLVGVFASSVAGYESIRELDELRGPVQSVRYEYAFVFGGNELVESIVHSEYDPNGYLVRRYEELSPWSPSHKKVRETECQASRDARAWECRTYVDGQWFETVRYIFDQAGRIVQVLTDTHQGGTQSVTYTYDEQGRLLEVTALSEDEITQQDRFVYDERGRVIQKSYLEQWTETYAVTETIEYNEADGSGFGFARVGSSFQRETVYSPHGVVKQTTSYPTDIFVEEYQYDEEGNVTTKHTFVASMRTHTYLNREYDDFGNWIRQERIHVSDPSLKDQVSPNGVWRRTISYYEDTPDVEQATLPPTE